MSCGACGKVRAHLPAAIRDRLAAVEARMVARRQTENARRLQSSGHIAVKYSVGKPP